MRAVENQEKDPLGALGNLAGGRFLATTYSRIGNPIAKEPGLAILSAGGVCLDSALHWWLRLLRVVPVCNSEPGSVLGLLTGDPDPRGSFPRSRGSRL